MILAIPSSEYAVLKRIAELDPQAFTELQNALQRIESSAIQTDMSEVIEQQVKSIKPSELKAILRTVSSLYGIKRRQQETPAEVANLLAASIESEDAISKGFTPELIDSLKSRLRTLLGIEGAIALASKSLSVMTRQDHTFCGVRIMSDVRPVFGESADSISAGMVIHNLNVQYHQDGDHKNFFVAMNSEDLKKLKEAVDRADKKDATLKSFLKKSGVQLFEDK